MIKNGKYRFTLQFGMGTTEEQNVGNFLEQLGKRKSPVVVAALNEYLQNHPELMVDRPIIQFQKSGMAPGVLEAKIRQLIEEHLSSGTTLSVLKENDIPNADKQISDDILDMLSDLDCFN